MHEKRPTKKPPSILSLVEPRTQPMTLSEALERDDHLRFTIAELVDRVGSVQELETLDDEPIAPEPFAWSMIDQAHEPVVGRLRATIAEKIGAFLDAEYAVIVDRLLAAAATAPQRPLLGSTKDDRLAAGLVWLALATNDDVGRRLRWRASTIWSLFGTSNATNIGQKLCRAIAEPADRDASPRWSHHPDPSPALRSPRFLRGTTRRRIIAERNQFEQELREEFERRPLRRRADGGVAMQATSMQVVGAVKGLSEAGRAAVTLVFENNGRPRLIAISVPDAHDLIDSLTWALNKKLPSLT